MTMKTDMLTFCIHEERIIIIHSFWTQMLLERPCSSELWPFQLDWLLPLPRHDTAALTRRREATGLIFQPPDSQDYTDYLIVWWMSDASRLLILKRRTPPPDPLPTRACHEN